jgi:hypothetical protein
MSKTNINMSLTDASNGKDASTPMMGMAALAVKSSNVPTLEPPTNGQTGIGINAAILTKKIVQTWSLDENRNFWINIGTVGWKKVEGASDSSITAYGLIASSARMANSTVDVYTDDATGMVNQLYVW